MIRNHLEVNTKAGCLSRRYLRLLEEPVRGYVGGARPRGFDLRRATSTIGTQRRTGPLIDGRGCC